MPIPYKIIPLLLALLLSGCTQHKPVEQTVHFSPPPSFSETGEKQLSNKWWEDFNDPQLTNLIETALGGNFSLLAAYNRLQQAEASYGVQRSEQFPQLNGSGTAEARRDEVGNSTTTSEKFLLGITASYEADLWGRLSALSEASRLQAVASNLDLETAAISLSAEVAATWYTLVEQRALRDITDRQIHINTQAREIISTQFRTGKAAFADVVQQQQLIEAKRAERTKIEEQVQLNFYRLNVLLGLPPTESGVIPEQSTLISLSEIPQTGLPLELLQNRPDLRASLLRIQANDQELAATIAEQYPKISISAGLDTGGSSSSDLFSDWLSNIAANLSAPIFDAGRISSQIKRQQAVLSEQVNTYNAESLEALAEVESALRSEKSQEEYLEQIKRQYQLSQTAMEYIKNRYFKGSEDYQRILTAIISTQGLEQNIVSAQADIITTRIELCRALAGGWQLELSGELQNEQ